MNYYEILKIPKNASEQQIKHSYKKLVKQYHPDLYVGDKNFAEQKIKEINEAYEILSHPEKKLEYDEYLNFANSPKITDSSANPNVEPHATPENPKPPWSFTKWITEKIELLDKKKQLQIFILILITLLALFLINLIQVNYYLQNNQKSSAPSTVKPSNSSKNENTIFTEEPSNELNDFKLLDDLFYDLFNSSDFSQEFETLF